MTKTFLRLAGILALILALGSLPAVAQQQISGGNVQITGNGNTAFVNANNALQVELHNGSTTIGVTGTSLNVNVTNGSSGGTSLADNAGFTEGTTNFTPAGCEYVSGGSGSLTSAHAGIFQCDISRRLMVVGAGTAGTATGGVLSIQGVASMTPLEVSPTTAANTVSNQFFSQLTDGTHGVTINSSTYTSKYGLDSNILGLDGAVFSASNALFGEITDGTNAMGAMVNFGASESGVKSLNSNASIYSGTTSLTNTGGALNVNYSSGSIPSGTNTIGKTTPVTACGTTAFNEAWVALPTSATAATTTTTCVASMSFCNTNASTAYTVTITDDQGSPVSVISATSIPPASCYTYPFNYTEFTSGIKWSASNAAITGAIVGVQ